MPVYSTNFTLEAPLNDLREAREWLAQNDVTGILKGDGWGTPGQETRDAIAGISWNLFDEQSGSIDLLTFRLLSQDELDAVSSWVRGQCSDGIGESFEQRGFASYFDEEAYDEDHSYWERFCDNGDDSDEEPSQDDDRYWRMASFDWRSNDYTFELVDNE